jgi:hypothetical protein
MQTASGPTRLTDLRHGAASRVADGDRFARTLEREVAALDAAQQRFVTEARNPAEAAAATAATGVSLAEELRLRVHIVDAALALYRGSAPAAPAGAAAEPVDLPQPATTEVETSVA